MKYIYTILLSFITMCGLLTACSSDDYLKAVPADCQALAAIDMSMGDNDSRTTEVLKSVLGIEDISGSGIDFDSRVVFFETDDGLFGLCAKVDDASDLQSFVDEKLTAKGLCQKTIERKDNYFTMIRDSWLFGFSDQALLVMGPVVSSAKATLIQQMVRLLEGKNKKDITDSRLFQRLDSIQAPFTLVTQARALPEQLAALLTLGAPQDADPSQVYLSLTARVENHVVDVESETFSFSPRLQKALQESQKAFRPVSTKYLGAFTPDMPAAILMNMDGGRLLEMMRENRGMQALLAGVNTAIDLDNILRSVDGDLSVFLPVLTGEDMDVILTAELKSTDFLKDVGYWKQSCPPGTRIEEVGKDQYRFTDGTMNFFFGVVDNQFYAGRTAENCRMALAPAFKQTDDITSKVNGQRLCLLVHLDVLKRLPIAGSMVEPILQVLFGKADLLIGHTTE